MADNPHLPELCEGPWAVDVDGSTHLAYDRPIYDAKKSPIAVCPDCGVRGGFEVSLVPDLVAEVNALREVVGELRKRTCKSLPPNMVWQDYYSPDDVCKIRAEHDAEVEKLRGAIETIRGLCETWRVSDDTYLHLDGQDLGYADAAVQVLAVIERTEQP